jgi:hypothetical protein
MIKELGKNDIKQALDLVNRVFSEFVAVDYSEQGNKSFNDYLKIKYEEVTNDVQAGHKKVWGYFQNDEIIGVIATKDVSHIALMFVDKQHHQKGIAKQLYNKVLSETTDYTDVTKVTVNSSPYAVPVYERLGFIKTHEQQEKEGIIYIPMTHTLKQHNTQNPIPLGTYRHYKGNLYEVISFVTHSESLEDMVVYKTLADKSETWVRPLSMWDNPIDIDGVTVKRFEYIGENYGSDERYELSEARRAITSLSNKCEKAYAKRTEGTSQQTLMKRRLEAFNISLDLINRKLEEL